jgi:hypothetical protein
MPGASKLGVIGSLMNNHKRVAKELCSALVAAQLSLLSFGAHAQGMFDGFFQSPEPRTEPPPVSEPDTAASDKPATTPKAPRTRRTTALKIVPLPPPRPAWLDADEPEATATLAPKATGEHDAGVNPSLAKPTEPSESAARAPDAPTQKVGAGQGPSQARAQQRTMTLIVRAGVKSPADLEGSRIALVQQDQQPESVSAMMQAQTGVHLNPVPAGWSAALSGLARGDVAGVLVSIGPALSASETAGLDLKGYRLMEVPVR